MLSIAIYIGSERYTYKVDTVLHSNTMCAELVIFTGVSKYFSMIRLVKSLDKEDLFSK